jgi:hypothetical protein
MPPLFVYIVTSPNVPVCGGSRAPTLSHRTRKDAAPSKLKWAERVGPPVWNSGKPAVTSQLGELSLRFGPTA